MSIKKSIQEKIAERKLNILKGFRETDEAIEKARAGIYADNAENRAKQRVGQKYGADKKEDVSSDKQKPVDKENKGNSPSGSGWDAWESQGKANAENWASETSDEDLRKFIDNAAQDEKPLVEIAKKELESRGGESNNIEVDFDNPESIKKFFSENKDIAQQFLDIVAEDVLTPPKQILQDLLSKKNTHSKIDSAQAALDDLKQHTNHPDKKEQSTEAGAKGRKYGMQRKRGDRNMEYDDYAGDEDSEQPDGDYKLGDQLEYLVDGPGDVTAKGEVIGFEDDLGDGTPGIVLRLEDGSEIAVEYGDIQEDYEPYNSKGQDKPDKSKVNKK